MWRQHSVAGERDTNRTVDLSIHSMSSIKSRLEVSRDSREPKGLKFPELVFFSFRDPSDRPLHLEVFKMPEITCAKR